MIGKLNHVAIAVADLEAATATYRDVLGAKVSDPVPLPEHGVTTVFVELPNTKIELLQPLGEDSPIGKFVERNPGGGVHHVCYEVEDLDAAAAQLVATGARAAARSGAVVATQVDFRPFFDTPVERGISFAAYVERAA